MTPYLPSDGYAVPLHGSLAEPITLSGAPRGFAILNGTLAAIIVFGLQAPVLGIPLFVCAHVLAYLAASRDPYVFSILPRHLRHRSYLDG